MTQTPKGAKSGDVPVPITLGTISAMQIKIKRVVAEFIGCAQAFEAG